MNTKETDPDTLQLLDELDKKWVRLWRKATMKKTLKKDLKMFTVSFKKITSAI